MSLTKGRVALPGIFKGLPVVMLTAIGAKNGKARTVPLVAIEDGERIVLIASSFGRTHHPGWYHNLLAQSGGALRGVQRLPAASWWAEDPGHGAGNQDIGGFRSASMPLLQ